MKFDEAFSQAAKNITAIIINKHGGLLEELNGKNITNTDLDDYHGHFHKTDEFPDGIYHYHITKDNPYIIGDGFFGVVGTISQLTLPKFFQIHIIIFFIFSCEKYVIEEIVN